MATYGAATYGGSASIGYYELNGFSMIDIDYEDDFRLAEVVYEMLNRHRHPAPRYFEPGVRASSDLKADADRVAMASHPWRGPTRQVQCVATL